MPLSSTESSLQADYDKRYKNIERFAKKNLLSNYDLRRKGYHRSERFMMPNIQIDNFLYSNDLRLMGKTFFCTIHSNNRIKLTGFNFSISNDFFTAYLWEKELSYYLQVLDFPDPKFIMLWNKNPVKVLTPSDYIPNWTTGGKNSGLNYISDLTQYIAFPLEAT
ncbi:MAG: hypothetical protein PUP46_07545 [Endozoicomonas sp. (ex Botrylloides leachii)]|nr:hypothetical protein [Endozoicomonas sp. (ex Botrylloides leachii)]